MGCLKGRSPAAVVCASCLAGGREEGSACLLGSEQLVVIGKRSSQYDRELHMKVIWLLFFFSKNPILAW